MEGDHIENVFKDKDKQSRYLNYCYEKEGKVVGGIAPANSMNLEELQAELKEFSQIYEMFKNYKKAEIGEKLKEKPFEHRRSLQQWVPEKLVCKRFGVSQPFQGKLAPLNLQKALIEKRNVFESMIQPLFEEGKRRFAGEEKEEEIKKKIKVDEEEEVGEEEGGIEEEKTVSMEIFKSIFDNEDD